MDQALMLRIRLSFLGEIVWHLVAMLPLWLILGAIGGGVYLPGDQIKMGIEAYRLSHVLTFIGVLNICMLIDSIMRYRVLLMVAFNGPVAQKLVYHLGHVLMVLGKAMPVVVMTALVLSLDDVPTWAFVSVLIWAAGLGMSLSRNYQDIRQYTEALFVPAVGQ